MKYVTIIGFGPPDGPHQFASMGVQMVRGIQPLVPGMIAKADGVPSNLKNIIREVSDDELQEYIDAGKEIVDMTTDEVIEDDD